MGILDEFMSGGKNQTFLGEALSDPSKASVLAMASGLLGASGPSTTPVTLGQSLGNAYMTGMRTYNTLGQQKRKDLLENAHIQQLLSKNAKEQKLQDFITSRLTGMPGAMPSADMGASTDALGQGSQAGDIGPTLTNATRMNSIRPQQVQGQNSSFPFSLNDVTALHAMGGPDLTASYKLATEPFQMNANSLYKDRITGAERYIPKLDAGMTLGPGGVASLVPGYVTSNNAIKGGEAAATETAKASLDPFYGMDGQGNKVLMGSRAGALGFGSGFGGGAGPMPGVGGAGAGNGGLGNIVTERNPAATTYDNEVAKSYAERLKAINSAGFTAPNQIAKLQRIGQLLNDHEGGKFSQTGLEIAQYANSLGLKIDKNLSNKEASAALSNELALSLRDPSNGGGMPGAMSDADRQFLASMAPGIGQSREGRQQMIDASIALQKRNQQVMQMSSKYAKKYGKVDDGFYTQLQEWADRNQLFGGK